MVTPIANPKPHQLIRLVIIQAQQPPNWTASGYRELPPTVIQSTRKQGVMGSTQFRIAMR